MYDSYARLWLYGRVQIIYRRSSPQHWDLSISSSGVVFHPHYNSNKLKTEFLELWVFAFIPVLRNLTCTCHLSFPIDLLIWYFEVMPNMWPLTHETYEMKHLSLSIIGISLNCILTDWTIWLCILTSLLSTVQLAKPLSVKEGFLLLLSFNIVSMAEFYTVYGALLFVQQRICQCHPFLNSTDSPRLSRHNGDCVPSIPFLYTQDVWSWLGLCARCHTFIRQGSL
jgi:hypothetical protein